MGIGVEAIPVIEEMIGVMTHVIAEMICEIGVTTHAIAEMIRETIVDLIVIVVMIAIVETIAVVEVAGDPLLGMIAETIVVHQFVEMIVGTIAEMIAVMIVVVIAMLITGVPGLELCLHPKAIVAIVHQGMIHQSDPEAIKTRHRMMVGVPFRASVNKCIHTI